MAFELAQPIHETGCPHADYLSWDVKTLNDLLKVRPKHVSKLWNIGSVRSKDIAAWRRDNGLNFTIIPGTPAKQKERVKAAKKLEVRAAVLYRRRRRDKIRRMWSSGRSYSYIADQLHMGFQEVHKIIDSSPAAMVRRKSKLIPCQDAR